MMYEAVTAHTCVVSMTCTTGFAWCVICGAGALSLAAKLGPTTRAVAARTVESLQQFVVKLPEEVRPRSAVISHQTS